MSASDLELIEKLERHIGFVYHRLNCDGNWYAQKIIPGKLEIAMHHYVLGGVYLRAALVDYDKSKTLKQVSEEINKMMNSFDREEFSNEINDWE
jgi:hypothetical protein